jgi:serine/threonine protein kinase
LKLLEAPNRVFDDPRCHLVKDSRTTKAGRCSSLPDGPELFIKRYNYQGFLYAMKDLVRSSRARRAWVTANGLQARGISTAPPVAYLERRRWRVLHESYLITEAIEGEGLLEFTRRGAESQAFFREKRRLVSEIATLLRRLHESGVSHRDLKGQNILLQEESPGRFRPLLVDLDGVRLGRVGWRRRVRDLARLARAFRENGAVTRTDRVRFLRAYLGPRNRPAQRTLWDRIAALEARARR